LVRPAYRTRSRRIVKRRTPSGKSRSYYRRRSSYRAFCAICSTPLSGVPGSLYAVRYRGRTEKRPERYYGGVVCPACLAAMLKLATRSL